MFSSSDILLGAGLPAIVAALMVVVGWALRGATARAAPPIAVALGFVAGYAAVLGVPRIPPLDTINWLFYAAPTLGALGAVDSSLPSASGRIARIARILLVMGLCVLFVWLLARPMLVYAWTDWRGPLYIGAIALVMATVWLSLDLLRKRGGATSLHLTLLLLAAVAAAIVAMSGSQKLGQIGGMLTAALGAVALLGLLRPSAVASGITLLFALMYVALITTASEQLYANLTHTNAALLLAAPLCAWAGELVPRQRQLLRGLVRIGAAALVALVAALLAGIAFAHSQRGYDEYGY